MRTRRLRLWLGILKIAHREKLDFDERRGAWPYYRVGSRYFIWKSYRRLRNEEQRIGPSARSRPGNGVGNQPM